MTKFADGLFNLLTGGFLDGARKVIDEVVTSKEEKQALDIRLQEISYREQAKLNEQYLNDKNEARDLYRHDGHIQKVYAITFLSGYLVLTVVLILTVIGIARFQVNIPEWGVAILSSIWGAMSSKVNTITDFFFGSSQGSKDKNEIMKGKG